MSDLNVKARTLGTVHTNENLWSELSSLIGSRHVGAMIGCSERGNRLRVSDYSGHNEYTQIKPVSLEGETQRKHGHGFRIKIKVHSDLISGEVLFCGAPTVNL